MSNKWKIIFYETDNGLSEVENFINSRTQNNRAKIYALLSHLEEKGPTLPRPYADLLQDGIHELRLMFSFRKTFQKINFYKLVNFPIKHTSFC